MSFQKSKIPNILTIIRILFVPIIVLFILFEFGPIIYQFNNDFSNATFKLNFLLAGILFVLASLTDMVDGYLARKNNWVSNFGKIWDPIADKILVNSVFICFAYQNLIPIWVPIITIARDVIVDAARVDVSSKKIVVSANIYGKLKTITQMFGITVIFYIFASKQGEPSTNIWWGVQNLLILLSTFLSVLSGIIYLKNIYRGQCEKL